MEPTPGGELPNFRLVTLCGSAGSKSDAMRDSQDIIEPLFRKRGIDVRPVDLGQWTLATVPALLREIARQQPDGILMQYPTGAFGHALGPIAIGVLQRVAPMMVMLHEFVAAHPVRKAAVGALLLRADRVAVTADRERDALLRRFPWLRRRIREVPIASNIPSRDWLPTQPPKVSYFGQVRPHKGLEEFFACVDQVAPQHPSVQFDIIGALMPNMPDYATFIRAEAARRGVTLTLDLEPDGVADALAAASVALLPYPDGASFRRGTMFAATACGVPVVTTFGPDTPPALTGFVGGGRTPAEVAALLQRLLTDESALMEAHRGSMALDGQYGWEKTVDHYVAVFAELARLRRPQNSPGQQTAAGRTG